MPARPVGHDPQVQRSAANLDERSKCDLSHNWDTLASAGVGSVTCLAFSRKSRALSLAEQGAHVGGDRGRQ